jgi:FkbM family methyltransferase
MDTEYAANLTRMLKMLLGRLGDNPIIFDVGASNGGWAWPALKVFPKAELHMFEPMWAISDDAYKDDVLRGLINSEYKVTRHPIAIGNRVGNTTLRLMPDNVSSTTLEWDAEGHFSQPRTVPMQTLDAVVAAGLAPQPALIKLDIQGGEMEALKGATSLLPRTKAIILEAWFMHGYGPHTPLLHEITAFLYKAHGFYLVDFGDQYRRPDGTAYSADVCFIKDLYQ